jgi:hypothetical protein
MRRHRAIPGLFLMLLVVAAWPVPPAAAEQAPFAWEAPLDATGHIAVSIAVTVETPTVCWFMAGAAGRHDASSPIRFWGATPSGAFYFSGANLLHMGAPPESERTLVDGTYWKAGVGWEQAFIGTTEVAFAASNIMSWEHGIITADRPFYVEVDCEGPFQVTRLGASRNLVTVREYSLDGVSAFMTLAHHDSATAGATFTNERVRTDVYVSPGTYQTGSITHHHPTGSDTYSLVGRDVWIRHEDGPGMNGIEVTRTSVGFNEVVLLGVFAGFDEVQNLDEVL